MIYRESGVFGPNYAQAAIEQEALDAEFALLTARLTPNRAMAATLIRDAIPPAEAFDFAQTINNLHDASAMLPDVFPTAYAPRIASGAWYLMADQVNEFGLTLDYDGQDTMFPLNGGRTLGLQIGRYEHLPLLRTLDTAMNKLHAAVTDENYRPVLCAEGAGFRQYRFVDLSSGLPPSVMLYIRPVGAPGFDAEREYGRNGKGVEASISYTVQLGDDAPIALTKREQRSDCISIRLDREAPDNPDGQAGVVSLDIGSILGPEDAFGTKAGRLLARGDYDASFDDYDSWAFGLNHCRFYDPRLGDSDFFAHTAMELDERLQARAIRAPELRRYYGVRHSGRLATTAVLAS